MTVKDIYDYLNIIAPFDTAEEWDNCGLNVGSFNKDVKKIYIALDVTNVVLEDAKSFGADLVITHHPMILTLFHKFLVTVWFTKQWHRVLALLLLILVLIKQRVELTIALQTRLALKSLKHRKITVFSNMVMLSPAPQKNCLRRDCRHKKLRNTFC